MSTHPPTCSVSDCNLPNHNISRQLCRFHYAQFIKGRPLTDSSAYKGQFGVAVPCRGQNCDRASIGSQGYCTTHRWRLAMGRDMDAPINNKAGRATIRNDAGEKCCWACGEWKTEDSYGVSASTPDGRIGTCRSCRCKKMAEVRATDEWREGRLQSKYGIGLDEFNRILEAQDGRCAICLTSDHGTKRWHVDHDHSCCSGPTSCGKCVRGLLCSRCNMALGQFDDDEGRMSRAIAYLRQHADAP